MQPHLSTDTALHRYVELDADYYDLYEAYQPQTKLLAQIRELQPQSHVITPSRYSCSDCARNIPQMAKIAEHLPGWTWDIFDSSTNAARKAALDITYIPTFIVYEQEGGREIGRIVENPSTGSLEGDLLWIIQNPRIS